MKIKHYLNNPKLKRVNTVFHLTEEQVLEYQRCANDPVYFINTYLWVVTLDEGFTKITLYPFQEKAVQTIEENRAIIMKAGRQVGKTTLILGYILWYILFNKAKEVAILANKAKTAREILHRIKLAYETLPIWLQQGVKTWNKGDIELENMSKIMADSTASSAIRGFRISLLYLDEFAFVPSNIAEEFFTSVYPTISSGKTSKVLITSTPQGMNHFYKMWTEATEGVNGFATIEANWRDVPGRDQAWADDQRRKLGETKFMQEVECEFLGSSGTLISGAALKALAIKNPIHATGENESLKIYEQPQPKHNYVVVADTSRGKGLDYSACVVIDCSIPYKLVATYKDNNISPLMYPSILKKLGEYYNNANVLIEINDNGQQVADVLFEDYGYENILSTVNLKNRTALTWGYGNKSDRGIRTTKSVKRLGCSILKELVETQKLIINDFSTISELSTFVAKKTSFEAEEGSHDDLAMCLVLFSWMTNQEVFSEMSDENMKAKLYQRQMEQIEEMQLPSFLAGHVDVDQEGERFVSGGSVWETVNR